jgi:hypothetical protein
MLASGSEMKLNQRYALAWLFVFVATGLAVASMVPARRRRRELEADCTRIDEASDESFPASDPPSFSSPAARIARL